MSQNNTLLNITQLKYPFLIHLNCLKKTVLGDALYSKSKFLTYIQR